MSDNIENLSGCFKNLTIEDLSFLHIKKTEISYKKGENIIKQGAFAPHVLFVNEGLARIYVETGNEKQVNLRLAVKGDYIGFQAIFSDFYQYSSMALSDAKICMIEKSALIKVIKDNPDFAMQITSRNCQNELRYLNIIKDISYKQMRGKLASALLYLTSDKLKKENVFQHLTRQNIADFASITVESTVKFLKEFEKEKIISLKNKNVSIQKLDALVAISNYS